MSAIKGHCLCGKVSYESSAEPVFTGICHCKSCQRATGSAFSVVIAVPDASLSIDGTLKSHASVADSGKTITRQFCPECGSLIADRADAMPGMTMLNAGTLDDTSWIKPGMQIFCESAQPWVSLEGDMHQFPKMPG